MNERELLQKTLSLLTETKLLEKRYQKQIDKFRTQLCESQVDRYRLGVIGVTSSGKSTMLNALLGENILSMAVRPSSSQLVTCSKSKEGKRATIYFEHKKPLIVRGSAVTASFLKKYSDESKNSQNKERVTQIELSSPTFAFPEEILLIDSPGLDAFGFEGHEKLTINELLPRIDICIFVTTCTTNSDMKMKQILDEIARYECPLIIVQNKLDSLRESVDKKKSIADVAREHRTRLERIVSQSKIPDKNSVKIIQISSKAALDARTVSGLTREAQERLYKKSNFAALIRCVNEFFAAVRPKIEDSRIRRVQSEIERILNEAQADLHSDGDALYCPNFEFSGYDRRIMATFEKTKTELMQVISKFESDFQNTLSSKHSFDNSDLERFKKISEKCGDGIVAATAQFRKEIEHYCEIFNKDARRLRVIDTFGAMPGLRIHEKTTYEKVKKSGVGNWFKRGWGWFTGDENLGYETVARKKYDHEATKDALRDYLKRSIYAFRTACEKWELSADIQVESLIDEYENRKESHEERKRFLKEQLMEKKSIEDFIKKLKALIAVLPKVKPDVKNKTAHIETDVQIQLTELALPESSYRLLQLSEKVMHWINRRTFELFVDMGIDNRTKNGNKFLNTTTHRNHDFVIGWDKASIARFLKYHYNMLISETVMKKGATQFDSVCIVVSPEEKLLHTLVPAVHIQRNLFLLFDTAQFGAGESAFAKSGIIKTLRKNDVLYLVVQNFSEIVGGDGITESIAEMFSIKKRFNIQCPCRVLLNDQNPVYNLAIVELQSGQYQTEVEKIQLIKRLKISVPYLMNPNVEKNISKLIDGYCNAHQ